LYSFGQSKGYSGGFQFKGMVANGFLNGGPETIDIDSVQIENSQKFGYVFGMTIRKEFNKTLAIESGLRFVQRNYNSKIDSIYGNYNGSIDYRVIGYEIPLKGMVRLRASDNSYFSVSLGGQIDFYPSDVFDSDNEWQVEVRRASWIQGSFLANMGWEIHPQNNGTFYIGFSFNQPFSDPFVANIGHYNTPVAKVNTKLNASYLSLDLRYYFEQKNDKPSK
jgi:hypothetical protein